MEPLEQLGFDLVGYGCTTCIGNSGPLDEPVAKAVEDNDLVVAAVLSGNRNFEGRIHPLARASYLASPPLVVAFALAGRVDIDLTTSRSAAAATARRCMLDGDLAVRRRDPSAIRDSLDPELFRGIYASVFDRRRALAGAARARGRPLRLGRRVDIRRASRRSSRA